MVVVVRIQGQVVGGTRQATTLVMVRWDAIVVPSLPPSLPPSSSSTKLLLLLLVATQVNRQMMRGDLLLLPVLLVLVLVLVLVLLVLTVGVPGLFPFSLGGVEEGGSNVTLTVGTFCSQRDELLQRLEVIVVVVRRGGIREAPSLPPSLIVQVVGRDVMLSFSLLLLLELLLLLLLPAKGRLLLLLL